MNENKPFSRSGKLSQKEIKIIACMYKRIGTNYYLHADILKANKEPIKVLKKWAKTTIKEDHGSKVFEEIEKYIDFVLISDNTSNYKRNIGNCYNIYEPLQFVPKQGSYQTTESFLTHIFGEYYNIGIDYLTILFTRPSEKLPALCLVSKEQKTGKSTFLHWLSEVYGENAVILGNEDFASNFNTSWVSKLVIGIDESFIEKRVIKEKIKRLVTDDTILSENKGVDKVRRDFIGKFILLSNNENNFIQMEKEDSRFFVLKIPTVKIEDPHLLEKLHKEIPAFLHFLSTRKLNNKKESRLWFKPDNYETEALRAIVKSSKTIIEKTMIEYLLDLIGNIQSLNEHNDLSEINITPRRLSDAIKEDIKYSNGLNLKIGEILKDWGLTPNKKPERYKYPVFDNDNFQGTIERILVFKGETGRYFSIPFSLINDHNVT